MKKKEEEGQEEKETDNKDESLLEIGRGIWDASQAASRRCLQLLLVINYCDIVI